MRGSFRIGRIAGIPIRVHWSFSVLILLVISSSAGTTLETVLAGLAWIAVIFASVTVHELGHSVLARRRGIDVRDIVLLPIGGISELATDPTSPQDELDIAVIGPLLSLAIAAVLAAVAGSLGIRLWPPTLFARAWIARAVWANVLIGLFNLIPALPLDGGRVLRAALARHRGNLEATTLTWQISRGVAWSMIAVGLVSDLWLSLIGVFVLLGARGEQSQAQLRFALADIRVSDVMIPVYDFLHDDDSLETVMTACRWAGQRSLPVLSATGYLGMLGKDDLVGASPDAMAGSLCNRMAPAMAASDLLYPAAVTAFARSRSNELAVMDAGELVGTLRVSDVSRLIAEHQQALLNDKGEIRQSDRGLHTSSKGVVPQKNPSGEDQHPDGASAEGTERNS